MGGESTLLTEDWHPRVKPEHGVARLTGGQIRIGGSVYGIAAEVIAPTVSYGASLMPPTVPSHSLSSFRS